MTIEREIVQKLRANLESAERCLVANDFVALKALAEQEARYMDVLKVIWHPT